VDFEEKALSGTEQPHEKKLGVHKRSAENSSII
jgi:hypothetical protein